GVTLMLMDPGLDTGPILAQAAIPIGPRDTTGSLTQRLAHLGAEHLIQTLPAWLRGEIRPQPQDDAAATYCQPLRKEDGRLDWTDPAATLDRQVRACDPWPGAFTTWQGRRLKILRVRPRTEWRGAGRPGLVVALEDGAGVVTGAGLLELREVQLAGKRAAEIGPFLHGQRDFVGSTLDR
ncbi:MAG: methionyl-tRNA formyltransferase, partial [Anaerolineae bacterium]